MMIGVIHQAFWCFMKYQNSLKIPKRRRVRVRNPMIACPFNKFRS